MRRRIFRFADPTAFTLIELVFVVLLLALFSSLAVPAVSNVLKMNLRRGATEVSGYLRMAYEQSVMRHQRLRVRFDLAKGTYWTEVYKEPEGLPLLDDSTKLDEAIDAFEELATNDPLTDEEAAQEQQKRFKKLEEGELKAVQLPDHIRFKGIYTVVAGELAAEGTPWVEFSPGGFASEAAIYVMNDDEDVYSVIIRPVGGKAIVERGEVRPADV